VFESRTDVFWSRTDVFESRTDVFESRIDVFESRADVFESRTDVFESRTDVFESRADAFESRTDAFESRTDAFESRTDVFERMISEPPHQLGWVKASTRMRSNSTHPEFPLIIVTLFYRQYYRNIVILRFHVSYNYHTLVYVYLLQHCRHKFLKGKLGDPLQAMEGNLGAVRICFELLKVMVLEYEGQSVEMNAALAKGEASADELSTVLAGVLSSIGGVCSCYN
jgi:hypothetical protein